MAFCTFSKDLDNGYTIVDNKFITKYLPEADGFAVKVYLYGLYLCENREAEFGISSMAEVLKTTEEELRQAFAFWEDYDLVEILAKDPFTVQYLPVRTAVGRPKKIRYEQYADFNKELQRKMQKVGKFISANDYVKYMHFLEENTLQPQALLLIAEYCINKQGENVSPSYIFNKAKKLIRAGLTTYEQVEKELSNYNAHEGDLLAIFSAMGAYQRTPDESDYALYTKWTEGLGFAKDGIIAAAKKEKGRTMVALNITLTDLAEKGKTDAAEIERYLTEREMLVNLTCRIGHKLWGNKLKNADTYIDDYVEKWFTFGFEEQSLLDIALLCRQTERKDFNAMHNLVQKLFNDGIVSKEAVKSFLKAQNSNLKLLSKVGEICGSIRNNAVNLSMVATWREWGFDEEMVLEAAKRSATSANPIPYMNKILSDWKQAGVYELKDIPSHETKGAGTSSTAKTSTYNNPSIEAADAKSARDRYYALRRQKAQSLLDKTLKTANANERFKQITAELAKLEIEIAKADVRAPEKLPALEEKKTALLTERKALLIQMSLTEEALSLKYECTRCQDTGFLPNGLACNCYAPEV